MIVNKFADKEKQFTSILKSAEASAMNFLVEKVPYWITSKHLTLASIPISFGVIICGYFGKEEPYFLYIFSFLIFLHWLTDALDGSVARFRRENEPKWGFYMDHLLDYIFMCSFVLGYSFLVSDPYKIWAYALLPLMGGLMVSEYLRFGAIKRLTVAHFGFGTIELQAILIILNIFIAIYGVGFFEISLPYVVLFTSLILIVVVCKSQKEILKVDRELKNKF